MLKKSNAETDLDEGKRFRVVLKATKSLMFKFYLELNILKYFLAGKRETSAGVETNNAVKIITSSIQKGAFKNDY